MPELNRQAIRQEMPAFIHHLLNDFEPPAPLETLLQDQKLKVPAESERKVVRQLHGRWSTVVLSRCGTTFYVTMEMPTTTVPKITVALVSKTKAEAIEGMRFMHWILEESGQLAAVNADAARMATSFSES